MYQLIAKWTILPGNEQEALKALKKLAAQVKKEEPDVLIYQVHTPDFKQTSLPTAPQGEVIFYEGYRNKAAFETHLKGRAFTAFVKAHGHLFLNTPAGIFMLAEVVKLQAGFIRSGVE